MGSTAAGTEAQRRRDRKRRDVATRSNSAWRAGRAGFTKEQKALRQAVIDEQITEATRLVASGVDPEIVYQRFGSLKHIVDWKKMKLRNA